MIVDVKRYHAAIMLKKLPISHSRIFPILNIIPKLNQKTSDGRIVNVHNIYKIVKTYSIVLFILFCNNLNAQELFNENLGILDVAISNDIILEINGKDAQAAIEYTLNSMLSTDYEEIQRIQPEIINSINEIIERVKKNKTDFIGISSSDFIKYNNELKVTPLFVLQRGTNYGTKYVIITNSDSNINSLSDLKSKTILTYSDKEMDLLNKWLFVEMKKEKIKNPSEIINTFVQIPEYTKRVFSLFFEKADGCILSKKQFESMCEINPQLNNKLKILYESPTYLTNLFCSNDNSDKKGISHAQKFITYMNKTKSGKEILKLFKAVKFKVFEDDFLTNIQKLYYEYNYYSRAQVVMRN